MNETLLLDAVLKMRAIAEMLEHTRATMIDPHRVDSLRYVVYGLNYPLELEGEPLTPHQLMAAAISQSFHNAWETVRARLSAEPPRVNLEDYLAAYRVHVRLLPRSQSKRADLYLGLPCEVYVALGEVDTTGVLV